VPRPDQRKRASEAPIGSPRRLCPSPKLEARLQEDALTERLRSSAAQFAQSGLPARLDEDWAVHLLHIATALELLAKAMLASLHGSLIAAPKDFDSLLHLSNHSRHARQPPDRVRTITMTDALARAGQVLPAIANLHSSLRLLADVRNGVVTPALSADAHDRVLVPFIAACDLLLDGMPAHRRNEFWGEFVEMVDLHLAESAKAAELAATEAVTLARLAFEERFSGMEQPTMKAVLASTRRGTPRPSTSKTWPRVRRAEPRL
jgi:hypothetical protein